MGAYMSERAVAEQVAKRSGTRTPFWDNARFACLVLVVVGHAIQRLAYDSDAALGLYLLIYAFHMPALAVISGYFSKSDSPSPKQMARVITDIVVPYLIFDTLWYVVQLLARGEANLDPARAAWTLWFLLALAIFRLLLPYLALLRWPLAWTVVISVAVGYLPSIDTTFSLSRALGLLPFFALGWWLRDRRVVERLGLLRPRRWWVPVTGAAILIAAGVIAWLGADLWKSLNATGWLFYKEHFSAFGAGFWWAGLVRIGLMVLALVLTVAFLSLVPLEGRWWTGFGQATMYIYLLHSFVLFPFRETGVLRGLSPDWLWLIVVVAGAVLVAIALATKPVRFLFRPLIEPRPAWLFADRTLVTGR